MTITGDEKLVLPQVAKSVKEFSFSNEWGAAHKDNVDTIWGYNVEDRLQMHYTDTHTTEQEQKGKLLLDVGCGNGILCKALAEKGATVFGIDYSSSVWNAQERMKHPQVCFIQADLHYLPFENAVFDIVYSNGVLHHTPDTENAFKRVALKVKKGGKYYVWLYKRSSDLKFNTFIYVTDAMRFIVNKLPHAAQRVIIEFLVRLKLRYNKARSRYEDPGVVRTNLYDTLTPDYKFYHTVEETKGLVFKVRIQKSTPLTFKYVRFRSPRGPIKSKVLPIRKDRKELNAAVSILSTQYLILNATWLSLNQAYKGVPYQSEVL